jgi:hypothetical protein
MKQAPWIIIIILLVALIITRECNRPDHLPDNGNVIADTIYRTDTIKGDSIPVPYPVVEIKTIDCTRIIKVPVNVDTAAILAAYFSENYYTNYPIVDDSNVFVSFDALVSENRLRWVVPYVQIKRPRVINHYTTVIQETEQRNKLFAGLGIGRSLNSFGLAPSLALLTKRQSLYSLHYDVMNKDLYFSMYFKIGKR